MGERSAVGDLDPAGRAGQAVQRSAAPTWLCPCLCTQGAASPCEAVRLTPLHWSLSSPPPPHLHPLLTHPTPILHTPTIAPTQPPAHLHHAQHNGHLHLHRVEEGQLGARAVPGGVHPKGKGRAGRLRGGWGGGRWWWAGRPTLEDARRASGRAGMPSSLLQAGCCAVQAPRRPGACAAPRPAQAHQSIPTAQTPLKAPPERTGLNERRQTPTVISRPVEKAEGQDPGFIMMLTGSVRVWSVAQAKRVRPNQVVTAHGEAARATEVRALRKRASWLRRCECRARVANRQRWQAWARARGVAGRLWPPQRRHGWMLWRVRTAAAVARAAQAALHQGPSRSQPLTH